MSFDFDPEVCNRNSPAFDPSKIEVHSDAPGGTATFKGITLKDVFDIVDELYAAVSGRTSPAGTYPGWRIEPCSYVGTEYLRAFHPDTEEFDMRSWGSKWQGTETPEKITGGFELAARIKMPVAALKKG